MAGEAIDALFAAIKNFSVEDVKRIIAEGVDLTQKDKLYGYTPLMYVVYFEDLHNIPIEILDAILASDTVPSFINMIDNEGKTALHHATDMTTINKLLEKGANLEAGNEGPVGTPLVYASTYQKHSIVDILLGKGASLTSEDTNSQSALTLYVQEALQVHEDLVQSRVVGYPHIIQPKEALYAKVMEILRLILTKAAALPAEQKSLVLDHFEGIGGNSSLHMAVDTGNAEIVGMLLNAGANVNVGYNPASLVDSGPTPLYNAAAKGDMDMIELLLSKGADTDAIDADGQTPVYGAIENNKAASVKRLLEAGADVDTHDNNGYTPLIFALESRSTLEVVNEVLAAHPDITVEDKDGLTAVDHAIQNDYPSIITKVVETAKINTLNVNGDTYLLQWLKGNEVLQECVKELLKIPDVDISIQDRDGNTALHLAVARGYVDIVDTLLEKGADITIQNGRSLTPLFVAVNVQKTDLVKKLIEKGADVNTIDPISGNSLLIVAIINNDIRTLEALLEPKVQGKPVADINAKNTNGTTALLSAVERGAQPLIIELLLEAGADVNVKNLKGMSPIHYAVDTGNVAAVSILLSYGADVNTFTETGLTPLMLLAANLPQLDAKNLTMILGMLVDSGADINLQDPQYGLTALHLAIDTGNYTIIRDLLDRFADASIKANDGHDMYETAKAAGVQKIIEILDYYKPRWKGLTKDDVEKLDIIFDTKAANYATCPVCLEYVERSEACMYMKHKCKDSPGYAHEELFEKYKNPEGYIGWCTICGRIAKGHRHYMASPSSEENPVLGPGNGAPFELDCRLTNGGGGLPEKLARFRAMRKYILKMKDGVGKLSKVAVLNGLVEAMWDGPLGKTKGELAKLLRAKAWNAKVSGDKFESGSAPAAEGSEEAAQDIPFTGTLPTVIASGHNNVTGEDEIEVIQFTHLQKDGTSKVHSIGAETLEGFVEGVIGDAERFGMCFMYPGACDSRLHHAELQGHIPEELYERYKAEFNKKFEAQVRFKFMEGGSASASPETTSIFNEAEDAVCVQPETQQQGRNKRKSTRKNRKNTTRRPARKSKASRKRK